MSKYERLYNEVLDLLYFYKEQRHIPESEAEYLITAVERIKDELDNENAEC